jgi:hypothetical protein
MLYQKLWQCSCCWRLSAMAMIPPFNEFAGFGQRSTSLAV